MCDYKNPFGSGSPMYTYTLLINSRRLFWAAWCSMSLVGRTYTVYCGRGVGCRQFLFLKITLSLSEKSHFYSFCKDRDCEAFGVYSILHSRVWGL